jgi:hypothetical protein
MQGIVVVLGTVAVLWGYGEVLYWSVQTGNWWWVFPLGWYVTWLLYRAVTSPEERAQGKREVRESIRDWRAWFAYISRPRR